MALCEDAKVLQLQESRCPSRGEGGCCVADTMARSHSKTGAKRVAFAFLSEVRCYPVEPGSLQKSVREKKRRKTNDTPITCGDAYTRIQLLYAEGGAAVQL